jgi:hypothetical protein
VGLASTCGRGRNERDVRHPGRSAATLDQRQRDLISEEFEYALGSEQHILRSSNPGIAGMDYPSRVGETDVP